MTSDGGCPGEPAVIAVRDWYRGCLLGGAVGDALGAGIEFASLADIRRQYGPAGVTGYVPCYGRSGTITDDTQMTLFTAEGLLRTRRNGRDVPGALWRAYQRWLLTQGSTPAGRPGDGWLIGREFLHHQRSPGMTCLSTLEGGRPGTASHPVNDSKGCGGVMRVAAGTATAPAPSAATCWASASVPGPSMLTCWTGSRAGTPSPRSPTTCTTCSPTVRSLLRSGTRPTAPPRAPVRQPG